MYKKIFFFILFSFGILEAGSVFAAEKIDLFDSYLLINHDGSVNVTEEISYDFGIEERHGIYRDIPTRYETEDGTYILDIEILGVTDSMSVPYTYEVSSSKSYIRIKIGDADAYVSGKKTYNIRYLIKKIIKPFDDHDELYWNVAGNGWEIPIDKIKTTVVLPASLEAQDIRTICFSGTQGSKDSCKNRELIYNQLGKVDTVIFYQDNLAPYEDLTIVTAIPKGIIVPSGLITPYTIDLSPKKLLSLFFMFFSLPLLVFVILLRRWWKYGRDPKGRGTIVTQFDAPKDMSPIEVGLLMDNVAHKNDVSAQIVDLAVRGFLKITRVIKGGKIFGMKDYTLEKLNPPGELVGGVDKKIMKGLFEKGDKVELSSLENKFYITLKEVSGELYKKAVTDGYFVSNPNKLRLKYLIAGGVIFFLGLFVFGPFGLFAIFNFTLVGIIVAIFGMVMPARTKKGVLAREHILGLKSYLQVAEKDRIKFHNAPQKDPKTFEKFLPFAMVLGVEKEWAKQFEGIYNTNPSWYDDPNMKNFSAVSFVGGLSSFGNTAQSALSSTPSSGGGGSGFGGGSSGGGFGGGGGGSW